MPSRLWLACALLLLLGCRAGPAVVPPPRALALRRDRYVLPPEPPPPVPRSTEAQRALEAEWPPVRTFAVPLPRARAGAPFIAHVRRARHAAPCAPEPALPAGRPCRSEAAAGGAVLLRAHPACTAAPPTLRLESSAAR